MHCKRGVSEYSLLYNQSIEMPGFSSVEMGQAEMIFPTIAVHFWPSFLQGLDYQMFVKLSPLRIVSSPTILRILLQGKALLAPRWT